MCEKTTCDTCTSLKKCSLGCEDHKEWYSLELYFSTGYLFGYVYADLEVADLKSPLGCRSLNTRIVKTWKRKDTGLLFEFEEVYDLYVRSYTSDQSSFCTTLVQILRCQDLGPQNVSHRKSIQIRITATKVFLYVLCSTFDIFSAVLNYLSFWNTTLRT